MTFSHSELNEIAANYARKTLNGGLVFIEHKCATTREIVDVAVYRPGVMINIEIKATRSDFLKDKTKPHRRKPSLGVGHYRFYCAPRGVINPLELPGGWGLLEVYESGVVKATVAPPHLRALQHGDSYLTRAKRESRQLNRKEADTLSFFFWDCNEKGHMDYLYSAFRQLLIAKEEGCDFEISGIFKKPQGLSFDAVVKLRN